MNHIFKFFLIAVAMVIAIPSFAVTDREMEAARTMAAKHYLRYANNGSDYLDKLNPSTMSELTASLKAKEKENIKNFNAVAVPKDYASWDKAKLVKYWSVTFFQSPGLKEDGKKCLGILAKNLDKISVADPAAAQPAQPTQPAQQPAAETAPEASAQPAPEAPTADAAGTPASDEELSAVADADAGVVDETPRKSSNTILYVIILIVLIGVVIWLVMYASKSLKETGASTDNKEAEREIRDAKRAAREEVNDMRDKYAQSLAAKNEEIKSLKAEIASLQADLEETSRELQRQQNRAAATAQSPVSSRQESAASPAPAPSASAQETPHRKTSALPPVVYLGYVNQRGLFVKASRSLNPDSTVYRMDIPDGRHGTFMVSGDSAVLDRVLSDISLWLEGGCVIENPEDADIATEIVTLQAGEALFADNSCRVTKKARIKFI